MKVIDIDDVRIICVQSINSVINHKLHTPKWIDKLRRAIIERQIDLLVHLALLNARFRSIAALNPGCDSAHRDPIQIHFGVVIGQLFTLACQLRAVNNITPEIVPPHDGRRQSRTHLFVSATLYWDGCSAPVHIRNMSPSGALVEAADLPEPGAKVILKRGSLKTTGSIAWTFDRKAGIALEAMVYVADWMLRQVSGHQNRVDKAVSNIKAGAGQGASAAEEPHCVAPVEVELTLLRADLAALGNALLGDEILIATHPEIQSLDISIGRIDRLLLRFTAMGDAPRL